MMFPVLSDLESRFRAAQLDQLVRELTAGKCSEPAAPPLKPGDICPCCCQLVTVRDQVAILNGVVRHAGCR